MSRSSASRRRVRRTLRWLWVPPLLALAACGGSDYRRYGGTTMGTYYQVTARCRTDVAGVIQEELKAVNDEMSTYLPDSTLSRFNSAPPGQWFPVNRQLAEVISAAGVLYRESAGAFDVTVGPLVNLWGFGPTPASGVPAPRDVKATLKRVGFEHLKVDFDPPRLRKDIDLYVDLSAIAKGHGVDRVVGRLRKAGCDAMLVDVGGEVRALGPSPSGGAWRIGVEVPDPDSEGEIERVIRLDQGAVATSGDYRNFFEQGGRRYSHTIDPRTGYPVTHDLASVSVVNASTMWADGYATLLTVLGPERGFEFAESKGLAVLFIVRTKTGYQERYTKALQPLLVKAPANVAGRNASGTPAP